MENMVKIRGGSARWKAGEASQVDTKSGVLAGFGLATVQALYSSLAFGYGVASGAWFIARCVLGAMVVIQGGTMGMQAYEEHALAPQINVMKQEQSWLVKKGLAPERRIGSLGDGLLRHSGVSGRTYHESPSFTLFGDWDASIVSTFWAQVLEEAGGPNVLTQANAISVGSKAFDEEGFKGRGAFVYRHEEGHAQVADHKLGPGNPSSWPGDVSKGLDQEIRQALTYESPNWRTKFLSSLWSEAFADAFAVLSTAGRGEAAYKRTALDVNKMRALPMQQGDVAYSALDAAGSDHAVDMASFLAGQFDPSMVSKLGVEDLRSLAGEVADASLAWALARQSITLDFFNNQGREWWMGQAKQAGLSDSRASAAWQDWKKDAVSARPKAAFEDFEAKHAGLSFMAKGLPASMEKGWRFDGYGGRFTFLNVKDSKQEIKQLAFKKPEAVNDQQSQEQNPEERQARASAKAMRKAMQDVFDVPNEWLAAFDAAGGAYLELAKRSGVAIVPEIEALAKQRAELLGSQEASEAKVADSEKAVNKKASSGFSTKR